LYCSRTIYSKEVKCLPAITQGNTCRKPYDCQQGLFCHNRSLTCELLKSIGESCFGGDCKEGLDCLLHPNTVARMFIRRTCQPLPTEGQFCNLNCLSNSYCHRDITTF
jgi:hypothetical protein